MSVKNKAKDRNSNGRIRRNYTGPSSDYWGGCPGWWVSIFMTRPQRRTEAHLCRLLQQDQLVGDEVVFPLGNNKPHMYYW